MEREPIVYIVVGFERLAVRATAYYFCCCCNRNASALVPAAVALCIEAKATEQDIQQRMVHSRAWLVTRSVEMRGRYPPASRLQKLNLRRGDSTNGIPLSHIHTEVGRGSNRPRSLFSPSTLSQGRNGPQCGERTQGMLRRSDIKHASVGERHAVQVDNRNQLAAWHLALGKIRPSLRSFSSGIHEYTNTSDPEG